MFMYSVHKSKLGVTWIEDAARRFSKTSSTLIRGLCCCLGWRSGDQRCACLRVYRGRPHQPSSMVWCRRAWRERDPHRWRDAIR